MKVLISDAIADECINVLKEEGIEVDYRPSADVEEIKDAINDADGLIVRSGTKVTADLIEGTEKLKVIGRAGAGVDNIDIPAATKKGILVMNSPSGNSISAAEHTFALMLAFARNIHLAHESLKGGQWERKKYKGIELYEKTLGIIGFGRIGKEVAKRALAFRMKVKVYDPYIEDVESSYEKTELEDIIKNSDIITVHIPMTDQTKGMIGSAEIAKMKNQVIIVNCSRGGIVDESALAAALSEGKIRGACIDVYEQEPPVDSPLCGAERICHTPHLAASTDEAQARCGLMIARQVTDYLKEGKIESAVNKVESKERK